MPIFSAGSASVSVVPDFSNAQRAITEFFARQSDVKVKVSPDLASGDVARTEAELNAMHGTAKVDVDRDFLSSAIGGAIGAAMSRSGLDKLGGLLTASIAPTVVTAIGGAFLELAAAASQAVGILALAPAAIAAIAAPAAVVAIGIHGVGAAFKALDTGDAQKIAETMAKLAPAARDFVTQIHALGPAWTALRLDVQQSLFAGVGSAVTNLASVALPILHTGLVGIAGAMNSGLLATLTALQGQGANFTTLFANIAATIRVASGAAAPLIQAFLTLAAVGSQFLPVLAQGFVNVATKFNDWVQHMAATGQLVTLIQNAINVLVQLGQLAGNVASVVVGVFTAALPYGNILLGLLIRVTGGLAAFVHSADGQTALKSFFSGITDALNVVLPALSILVQAIVTAVLPAIGEFAKLLAPIGATLLTQLAAALRAVGGILPSVASVMAALVNATAPLIPVISQIITALLPPLLGVLGQLAPILGQVATIVGQALLQAVRLIAPILPQLGAAFIDILKAILPLLPALIAVALQLLPPLLSVVKALIPIVQSAVSVFAGIAGVFLQIASATVLPLVVFLLNAFAAGLKFLAPILGPLAGIILAIVAAVKLWAIAQAILDIALDANPIGLIVIAIVALIGIIVLVVTHLNVLKNIFGIVVDWIVEHWRILVAALPLIGPVILLIVTIVQHFGAIWQAVVDGLLTAWRVFSGAFVAAWNAVWSGVSSFAQNIWNALSSFFSNAWNGWLNAWHNFWNAVLSFFQGLWSGLVSWIQGVWSALSGWFANAWNGWQAAWQNFWNAVLSFFQRLWTTLVGWIQNVWSALSGWFQNAWNGWLAAWQNFWNAVLSFFQRLWTTLVGWIQNTWSTLHNWFQNALNFFYFIWQGAWNNIFSFFQRLWTGLVGWVQNTWNTLHGWFQNALNFFYYIWNGAWNNVSNAFQTAWNGIKGFAQRVWNDIKAIIAVPVNFVIGTILNNGLFRAWNAVNDFLHLPFHIGNLPTIPGFARGGYTGHVGLFGTGDREDPAGVVHAREFVFTANQVDSAGGPDAMYALAARLDGAPGYAAGGQVRSDPVAALAARLDSLPGYAGGGFTWPQLDQIRRQMFPGSVLTSAYRPGANDYHGLGEAIDIGWPGNAQSGLMPIAAALARAYPNSTELIHNPNGSIKNGHPVSPSFWGAATWAAHLNHVHWAMTPAALAGGGGGGIIPSVISILGRLITGGGDILSLLTDSITGPINSLLHLPGGNFVQILAALPKTLLGGLWNLAKDKIGSLIGALLGGSGTATPVTGSGGSVAQEAYLIARQFGWGSSADQAALNYIASHESGWNPRAQNPSSSASGIWQLIDSTWDAYRPAAARGYAHAKDAPSSLQDWAGLSYIKGRYGNPPAAQSFWQTHHFYDGGGWLPPGYSTVFNGTGGFEAVLNQAQQSAVVGAVTGRFDRPPVWHFYLGDREITDLIDARVTHWGNKDSRAIRSGM